MIESAAMTSDLVQNGVKDDNFLGPFLVRVRFNPDCGAPPMRFAMAED
jgi:hypothetical protein